MQQEIIFLQSCLTMNYLQPADIMNFFQAEGYDHVPQNIDQILVQTGLLAEHQKCKIHDDISRQSQSGTLATRLELRFSQNGLTEMTLTGGARPTTAPGLQSTIGDGKHVAHHADAEFIPASVESQKEEGLLIGKIALQKRWINIAALQQCMNELQKMLHEGHDISLTKLLLQKRLISEQQLAEAAQELSSTRVSPCLAEFNGQEIVMGKYRIVDKLGQGGMGIVYKVEHMLLPNTKFFALKIMHPQFAASESNYRRFVREVEISMSLLHKNIIAIREFGLLPSKAPYLIMDFCPGKSLDSILRQNWTCDIGRSLHLIRQMLDGLGEAHSHNTIHRDLKPANILIESDDQGREVVKILDFGLAKLVQEPGEGEAITQGIVGTPLYMSPEQASGNVLDPRSDLYSVGLILYEMVTGKRPFQSNSLQKILIKQIFEQPPLARQLNPKVPEALEAILATVLAKKPENRYNTTQEFMAALDEFCQTHQIAQTVSTAKITKTAINTAQNGTPTPNAKNKRKGKSWFTLLLVFVIASGTTTAFMVPEAQTIGKKYWDLAKSWVKQRL